MPLHETLQIYVRIVNQVSIYGLPYADTV